MSCLCMSMTTKNVMSNFETWRHLLSTEGVTNREDASHEHRRVFACKVSRCLCLLVVYLYFMPSKISTLPTGLLSNRCWFPVFSVHVHSSILPLHRDSNPGTSTCKSASKTALGVLRELLMLPPNAQIRQEVARMCHREDCGY